MYTNMSMFFTFENIYIVKYIIYVIKGESPVRSLYAVIGNTGNTLSMTNLELWNSR